MKTNRSRRRPIRFCSVACFKRGRRCSDCYKIRFLPRYHSRFFFIVCHDQKQHACGVNVSACHNVRFHGLGACKCKFGCLTCSSVRHLSVLASFLLSFFLSIQLWKSYRPKHSEIIKACFLEFSIYRTFYKFISQIIPKQKRKKSLNWIVRTQCIHKQVSEGKISILLLKMYQLSIN